MLTVTRSQVQEAAAEKRRLFLERVGKLLESGLAASVTESTLHALFVRAQSYGLISERDYAGYIFIATAAGVEPPAPDPDWLTACLQDGSRPVTARVANLFEHAKVRLRPQI